MSVFVSVRFTVDPAKFEQFAQENRERFVAISQVGKSAGAVHHRFVATDTEVMAIDEWGDAEQFRGFFGDNEEIRALMGDLGVTSEPTVTFFRPLDVGDEF